MKKKKTEINRNDSLNHLGKSSSKKESSGPRLSNKFYRGAVNTRSPGKDSEQRLDVTR